MTAKQKLIKTRIKLTKKRPFFGRLSLLLELVKTRTIATAGVDGERFYYNEDYINSLTNPELEAVFMHEILHVALGHIWRIDKRNRMVWNFAADYAVNLIVHKNSGSGADAIELPDKALLDFRFSDMNAESIYEYLMKNVQIIKSHSCSLPKVEGEEGFEDNSDKQQNSSSGSSDENSEKEDSKKDNEQGGGGDNKEDKKKNEKGKGKGEQGQDKEDEEKKDKESKGSGKKDENQEDTNEGNKKEQQGQDKKQEEEKEQEHKHQPGKRCRCGDGHKYWGKASRNKNKNQIKAQWDATMEGIVRDRGTAPAGMERLIDELTPQENWKAILANYLSPSKSDFDFMKRDRRSLNSKFYFPDLSQGEALEDVIAVVDTSGSVQSSELNYFITEVKSLFRIFDDVKGWLIDCDAAVNSFVPIAEAKVKTKFYGGGGTDHAPVFKEIKKRGIRPRVVICFTDLYTSYPSYIPDYPVLWLATKNCSSQKPPFGRVINLKGSIDVQ